MPMKLLSLPICLCQLWNGIPHFCGWHGGALYPAIRGLAYRGLEEEGHASLPDVRLPWMPWMCVCEYARVYVRVCVAC